MKTSLKKLAILLFVISLSINVKSQIEYTLGFGLGHTLTDKVSIRNFTPSVNFGAFVLPINYNLAVNIDADIHYADALSFDYFQLFAPITANLSYGAGASPYPDHSFGIFAGAGFGYILDSKTNNGTKERNHSFGLAAKYGFRFYKGDLIYSPNISHSFNFNSIVPNQFLLNISITKFL